MMRLIVTVFVFAVLACGGSDTGETGAAGGFWFDRYRQDPFVRTPSRPQGRPQPPHFRAVTRRVAARRPLANNGMGLAL